MKQPLVLIMFVLFIGVYFLGSYLFSKKYSNDLAKALAQKDMEKTKEMLFSKKAVIFLNSQSVSLMRASYHCSTHEYDEALKYCKMINICKLSLDKKLSYYATEFQIALNLKNMDLAEEVQSGLREINKDLNNEDIQNLIDRNEIHMYLMLKYHPKVISMINKQIVNADEKEKGMLYLSLAKAYHYNHQDQEAIVSIKKAKKYLTDKVSLEIAESALNDLHLLD